MPTPTASDGGSPGGHRGGGPNLRTVAITRSPMPPWREYAEAISRWERISGRAAPSPVQAGVRAEHVLAPVFVEWLMGLGSGWVTGLPLPRTRALQILGNGVVPLQAAVALRILLCTCRWGSGRNDYK